VTVHLPFPSGSFSLAAMFTFINNDMGAAGSTSRNPSRPQGEQKGSRKLEKAHSSVLKIGSRATSAAPHQKSSSAELRWEIDKVPLVARLDGSGCSMSPAGTVGVPRKVGQRTKIVTTVFRSCRKWKIYAKALYKAHVSSQTGPQAVHLI